MNNINEESIKRIIRNIQQLGERFCQALRGDREMLENNWWEALKFFFGRTFFGGRRDKLSNEYYQFTIQALEENFFNNQNLEDAYNRLISATEDEIRTILQTPRKVQINWEGNIYEKELCLKKEEDIEMVLDVLHFIRENNIQNIYLYLKDKISQGNVEEVYHQLDEIYNVGDKKACLTIRDILLINPEIEIEEGNYQYAFPVDTWVRKLCNKLGVNYTNDGEIKEWFINKCFEYSFEYKVDPLKVAAGLWYLGFNSLDIALELLERCKI